MLPLRERTESSHSSAAEWPCLCSSRKVALIPGPAQWVQWVKWRRLQLQLGFDPWPRNSVCLGGDQKRKKKEREREKSIHFYKSLLFYTAPQNVLLFIRWGVYSMTNSWVMESSQSELQVNSWILFLKTSMIHFSFMLLYSVKYRLSFMFFHIRREFVEHHLLKGFPFHIELVWHLLENQ